MLDSILTDYKRIEIPGIGSDACPDFCEKIGDFALLLLRVGIGQTFEVRQEVLGLVFKAVPRSTMQRITAIALFSIGCVITVPLALIGVFATLLSCSRAAVHRERNEYFADTKPWSEF